MRWADEHQDFDGGVDETAATLAAIVEGLPWARGGPKPSVRLIRYYAQEGGLDRPERQGKEARYGFRHIVQFLAMRALILDGWPVRKAADEASARSVEELMAIIPPDDALARRERPIAGLFGRGAGKPDPVSQRQSRLVERRARVASLSEPAGAADVAAGAARAMIRLDLAPWAHAFVDADRLETLSDNEAETLGDALAQALIDARPDAKGRRRR